jgi:demethylmenaquinone methyltransferase/2-methoxy-6-polyprenyl-1,4-benzoquinol methylase
VLLAELACAPSPPRRVWGIDSSPEMLALAPELPGGWRLDVADATELPFADDSFDLVTASYLLHLLCANDRRRVIEEIRRVLRPTGRLGTITVAPPRGRLSAALTAPVRIAARRSRGRLAGLRSLDPAPELAAAGFPELARRRTVRGYPSLCVVAGRDAGPSS